MSQIKNPFAHKFTPKMAKERIIQVDSPLGHLELGIGHWQHLVTGHRMQINLWAAANSNSNRKQNKTSWKLWQDKCECVCMRTRTSVWELKLDRNHAISSPSSSTLHLLRQFPKCHLELVDKLNCAYSCINCTHTRDWAHDLHWRLWQLLQLVWLEIVVPHIGRYVLPN